MEISASSTRARGNWHVTALVIAGLTFIVGTLILRDIARSSVANQEVGQLDNYTTRWSHDGVLIQVPADTSVVKELRTEYVYGRPITQAVIKLPHMKVSVVGRCEVPTPEGAAELVHKKFRF